MVWISLGSSLFDSKWLKKMDWGKSDLVPVTKRFELAGYYCIFEPQLPHLSVSHGDITTTSYTQIIGTSTKKKQKKVRDIN